VSWLSTDQSTAAGQIPVEVANMRSAGVDTVVLASSFLNTTPFVQTAEGQGWNPRWLVSEFSGQTSDFEVQAMPPTFDGALAMTQQRFNEFRLGLPEPAADAHCRELYEHGSGQALPRNNGDTASSAYEVVLYGCAYVNLLEAGLRAAGPTLTRAGFGGAMQSLGPRAPAMYLPGTFKQGKTDMNDTVRFLRFSGKGTYWVPVSADTLPVRS
jgi:hypothetical protein